MRSRLGLEVDPVVNCVYVCVCVHTGGTRAIRVTSSTVWSASSCGRVSPPSGPPWSINSWPICFPNMATPHKEDVRATKGQYSNTKIVGSSPANWAIAGHFLVVFLLWRNALGQCLAASLIASKWWFYLCWVMVEDALWVPKVAIWKK